MLSFDFNRKSSSKISPFAIACILNAILLALYYFSGTMKYEVSDDFLMQIMVSGTYSGEPSPYIMFMNPLIGILLSQLYSLCSTINWYFYFQVIVIYCTLTSFSYLLLKKSKRSIITYFYLSVFLFFFSSDLYQLIQFTKTAMLAICCGEVFLLYALYAKQSNMNYKIYGFFCILLGTMIRSKCFFISMPFFLITAIYVLLLKKDSTRIWSNGIKKLCLLFISCICVYAITMISSSIYVHGHQDYATYKEFSSERAEITDYKTVPYEKIEQELNDAGITKTEYLNFIHWGFGDSKIYNIKTVKQINDILAIYRHNDHENLRSIIRMLLSRGYYKYLSVLGCVILFICYILLGHGNRLAALLHCTSAIALIVFLIYMGRIVYRVEYAIFLSLGMHILLLYIVEDNLKSYRFESCVPIVLVLLAFLKVYGVLPINDMYNFEVMNKSWLNDLRKYRVSFTENKQSDFLQTMYEETDNLYLLGFQTTIQSLYLNYDPRFSVEPQAFKNFIYLSGVDAEHPERMTWYSQRKLKHSMDILLKENVYLVENSYQNEILDFVIENYKKDATMKLYGDIDGYKIWKLS